MTTFLRLLANKDKANILLASCAALRTNGKDASVFQLAPDSFRAVPGAPFAYWISENVRDVFSRLGAFVRDGRIAQHGASTKDDFRFLRLWWEPVNTKNRWSLFAKGGAFSPFYADIYLVVNWVDDARELEAALLQKYPYLGDTANWVLHRECQYFHPGLTWSVRTSSNLSLRVIPQDCIFSHKGPAAFVHGDLPETLLALCAITNSEPFRFLISLQLAAADAAARSYEVGVLQKAPVPDLNARQQACLARLACRAWSLSRTLDTTEEASHAFLLPGSLRPRQGDFVPFAIEAEQASIQTEIDVACFDLYGFCQADLTAVQANGGGMTEGESVSTDAEDDVVDVEDSLEPVDQTAGLLSWAVGVAFGRFDWRLATGDRPAPPEPDPFAPLPAKSPGMLPDGAELFHNHADILVDDAGYPHDLPRLVEEVLARVDAPVAVDVRRWIQRDFFPVHLQRYSKSRRKAPIYWPLATASAGYTLWLYYPRLTGQTLFTAVNDFIDPKLEQIGKQTAALRSKASARSREEDRGLEALQALEAELMELRNTLLRIAPTYRPNHDDGVQITAAPIWPLFRHKPWQKLLKDTWAKLEKGEYDWAHLAMAYWPDRVREKCRTDKSLAIAHDLESLYVPPEPKAAKPRGRKKASEA